MIKISGNVKDETGKKYGMLIVIEPYYNHKTKGMRWLCKCDCGNYYTPYGFNLRNGMTTHCGCQTKRKQSLAKIIDIAGNRYGRLVAIENTGKKKNNNFIWKCKCDCGKIVDVPTGLLTTGNTRSCGCINIERMSKLGKSKRLKNNQGLYNQLYYKYKHGANRRGLSFELTMKEFKNLIDSKCFYCGAESSQLFKGYSEGYSMLYNGVDRVDNNKGYSKDNCVPCCKTCNFMKLELSFEEFIKHLKRIVSNIGGKNV